MLQTNLKIFLMIIVVCFLAVTGCANNNGQPGENTDRTEITVTDLEGRSVTLNYPVERVILMESSKTAEFSAICGDGFAEKIVGWDNDFKNNAGDGYQNYLNKYPQLADIPDVGSLDDSTFSIEKVISLQPDVVIMHSWQFMWCGDAIKDALAKLEQAGIPVLFVDFYMEPMTNSTRSMLLLGEIMGEKQRAQEIVDFYNDRVDAVYSRLAGINGNKPDVYIECASKGPDDYGISYGNVGWGSIVSKAGGNNIAEPPLGEKSEALSPEYLVDNNPDIIILTGRHWSTPGSLRLGYVTSPDEARSTMEPFIRRPGWNTIDAVKNNRVYGIYHGYCFSVYNFAALETMAKWCYPEEFKDLDPDTTLKEYHDRFMPIGYTGTFLYHYN